MNKTAFDIWMNQVDQELIKICGFTSDCLADYYYADKFQDGEKPAQVAIEVLEYNDFPLDEFGL